MILIFQEIEPRSSKGDFQYFNILLGIFIIFDILIAILLDNNFQYFTSKNY